MAKADQLTIARGGLGIELMNHAGRAVFDVISSLWEADKRIGLFAGPGNNGGDAFVLGRLLIEDRYSVRAALLGNEHKLNGDAQQAAHDFPAEIESECEAICDWADILVDGLFGAGLHRDITDHAAQWIQYMNKSEKPIIAIDLPSGIDGENGQIRGNAVHARKTVTFFRAKPGHILLPGRLHCGDITIADIGIRSQVLNDIKPQSTLNRPTIWRSSWPVTKTSDHKYNRGHAVAVSGSINKTGAARLAAGAALRVGAGLVSLASPVDALQVNASHLTAIMVEQMDGKEGLQQILSDPRKASLILGPGLGISNDTCSLVEVALTSARDIILDADALTSFADNLYEFKALIERTHESNPHGKARQIVLTPHAGEFYRLFDPSTDASDASINDGHSSYPDKGKIEAACWAAQHLGVVLVYKGADTVVAAPDGRISIADNAPPFLATAGSGDVLAGIIGGLLAQGMPAFEAASAGVWLHGEAGNIAGFGMTADDLDKALHRALQNYLATLPE